MTRSQDTPGLGTQVVWGGESRHYTDNAAVVPIVNSVTYAYDSVEQWQAVGSGQQPGYLYGRSSNPTVTVFEQKMQQLEQAEAATAFASGMAAVSNTLFALLSPGQRVVVGKDIYGGTAKLFSHYLPRFNINVCLCDTSDLEAQIAQGCDLLYLETPTNPLLKLLDIEKLSRLAHQAGAVVVVDNTLASPINQQPLQLGADIVVHSATKYIGGHSDVIGGIACGRKDLIEQIFAYREITGASLDPNAASLLIRGLKTLSLRIARHNDNALQLARFVQSHPKVASVNYPGLPEHPDFALGQYQMSGSGGLFSFSLVGGFEQSKAFLNQLQYAHLAASLGSVETLIGPPSVTSHAEFSRAQRERMGIFDNLIRCSVGIEDPEDLIADFAAALAAI